MKRLFFALWPDTETRQRCAAVAADACRGGNGRAVSPGNLHVTLTFLGGIDEPTEATLTEASAALDFGAMSIKFDKLDYWRKPRIICLTGRPEEASTGALVRKLNALAVSSGIEVDRRPFQAHVTLIRKARKLPSVTFEPILWKADAFCLAESCSMPGGVVYRVLKTWNAAPSADG